MRYVQSGAKPGGMRAATFSSSVKPRMNNLYDSQMVTMKPPKMAMMSNESFKTFSLCDLGIDQVGGTPAVEDRDHVGSGSLAHAKPRRSRRAADMRREHDIGKLEEARV